MTNKAPTADWPPIRGHYNVHSYAWKAEALEVRLRDTAAALRDMIDRAYLPESLTNARAILAALEQEGLT